MSKSKATLTISYDLQAISVSPLNRESSSKNDSSLSVRLENPADFDSYIEALAWLVEVEGELTALIAQYAIAPEKIEAELAEYVFTTGYEFGALLTPSRKMAKQLMRAVAKLTKQLPKVFLNLWNSSFRSGVEATDMEQFDCWGNDEFDTCQLHG